MPDIAQIRTLLDALKTFSGVDETLEKAVNDVLAPNLSEALRDPSEFKPLYSLDDALALVEGHVPELNSVVSLRCGPEGVRCGIEWGGFGAVCERPDREELPVAIVHALLMWLDAASEAISR
jgi:hypothetical protein